MSGIEGMVMIFKRRLHGASRLEAIAIVAMLGVLAAILLNRLTYYEELTEKAKMEYKASAIRSALRVQMSLMLIQGRAQDYALLAQQNPLDWLTSDAEEEGGQSANESPVRTLEGDWTFDPASRTLSYMLNHGDHFEPDSSGQKRVRWQVKLVHDSPNGSGNAAGRVVGASLVLVEPYRWF